MALSSILFFFSLFHNLHEFACACLVLHKHTNVKHEDDEEKKKQNYIFHFYSNSNERSKMFRQPNNSILSQSYVLRIVWILTCELNDLISYYCCGCLSVQTMFK